jgi:hypothetical protein
MAFTTLGMSGVNFNQVDTAPGFTLGTQVFGSDGKLYVYAVAGAAISADDADCSVNATTFVATASGGAYKAPNVAVASGSYAWFGKASV